MSAIEPDEIHDDVDPDATLDLTGDALVDEWRGVKVEDAEEETAQGSFVQREVVQREEAPEEEEETAQGSFVQREEAPEEEEAEGGPA